MLLKDYGMKSLLALLELQLNYRVAVGHGPIVNTILAAQCHQEHWEKTKKTNANNDSHIVKMIVFRVRMY